MQIVLASSSPYRKQQLRTLGIDFVCAAPDIDESAQPGESAQTLALRLAEQKARAVCAHHPDALVIGCDQTLAYGDAILGKPGDRAGAFHQWQQLRGHTVAFHSAIALLDTRTQQIQCDDIITHVTYRDLSDAQIISYLDRDQPFDCAGSFKSESLGIATLAAVHSTDPSALVGLPLIALTQMLANAGVDVLAAPAPSR